MNALQKIKRAMSGSEVGLMLEYKEMIGMKWKFEPCTYLEDEYSR